MAKRDYNGPAIDASWSDPPWANDGETVDVIDTDEDGEVSVDLDGKELFPEPWEPTEEQVARARWLLLNGDVTGKKIAERVGIEQYELSNYVTGKEDVNPESPPPITAKRGGEYRVMDEETKQAQLGEDTSEFNGIKPGTPLDRPWVPTESQVAQARALLLQTEATSTDLAKHINAAQSTISKYIRGDADVNPHDPPPLTGKARHGEYKPLEESDNDSGGGGGYPTRDNGAVLSEEDVIEVRKRLVNDESRADVAEDYDVSKTTIGDYAAGRKTIDPDEIEVHCEDANAGWERVDDTQTDTDTDEQTEAEPEREEETDTEDPVHVTPTVRPNDDTEQNRTVPVVVGFIVGIIVSAIARRLT